MFEFFILYLDDVSEKRSSISFVIINPSCDLKLEEGDMVYLIRPSPIKSKKTFLTRGNSIRASKASLKRRKVKEHKVLTSSVSSPPLTTPNPGDGGHSVIKSGGGIVTATNSMPISSSSLSSPSQYSSSLSPNLYVNLKDQN